MTTGTEEEVWVVPSGKLKGLTSTQLEGYIEREVNIRLHEFYVKQHEYNFRSKQYTLSCRAAELSQEYQDMVNSWTELQSYVDKKVEETDVEN